MLPVKPAGFEERVVLELNNRSRLPWSINAFSSPRRALSNPPSQRRGLWRRLSCKQYVVAHLHFTCIAQLNASTEFPTERYATEI